MFFILGDWRYFWPENIINFIHSPSAWDASLNTGIGLSGISTLWITSYLNFTAGFFRFGLSWNKISLLFWILPSLIFSFFSAFYFFRKLISARFPYGFLAGFIYLLNTYALMIITGGQMGVMLSYSLVPLVILFFIRTFHFPNIKNSLLLTIVIALQVLFDPRIVYITLLIIAFYVVFHIFDVIKNMRQLVLFCFLIPFIFVLLLHSYWILPLLLTKSSPLPKGFDSVSGLIFFSFAKLEDSLSLLHPNWPENIFGKTYFMRPDFILVPILAFSSLLFVSRKKPQNEVRETSSLKYQLISYDIQKSILFLSLLGLIGAFLAKGVNDPFGGVYIWLFTHIPGFMMFRDPTKWYILTAFSYSILISFSIGKLYDKAKGIQKLSIFKFKFSNKNKLLNIQNVFLLFTFFYLLFLIKPALTGSLGSGTKSTIIPDEYIRLEKFLSIQPDYFRTYWIPVWQRFGYFSNIHPAIGRNELGTQTDPSRMAKEVSSPQMESLLKDFSVKYIIVPYDSNGEIFLKDRKYNELQYKNTISLLNNIPWLEPVKGYGKIALYKLPDYKDHFWLLQKNNKSGISYKMISSDQYTVQVRNVQKGDRLIFSEGFDKNWFAQDGNNKYYSQKYNAYFNSFVLPKDGNYTLNIYYEPQKWVDAGLRINLVTIVVIFGMLIYLYMPEIKEFRRRYL